MFKNISKIKSNRKAAFLLPTFADGSVQKLPIDDFPVSDSSNYSRAKWPLSDIGILDRFQRSNVSREQVERVASRLEEINVKDTTLTDDEKLAYLRPAWVQTASERASFDEYLYQVISERKNADVQSTADVKEVVEKVDGDVTPADVAVDSKQ